MKQLIFSLTNLSFGPDYFKKHGNQCFLIFEVVSYCISFLITFQVSTMPDQALQAFIDHGIVARTIDSNASEAEGIYNALQKLGIDWRSVGSQLELEGVDSFKKSFESLLDTLQEKANSLKLVSL